MPAILRLALTVPALLLVALAPSASAAATCAERPVAARGDASRFVVLAKANARGNWRAKVRSMPTLGAEYANFIEAASEPRVIHTVRGVGYVLREPQ